MPSFETVRPENKTANESTDAFPVQHHDHAFSKVGRGNTVQLALLRTVKAMTVPWTYEAGCDMEKIAWDHIIHRCKGGVRTSI